MTEREDDDRLTIQRVLGNELQRWRRRKGWSLRELADEARFDHAYIGRVERGDQLPSEQMASRLDVTLNTDGTFTDMLMVAREKAIQDYERKAAAREQQAERIQVFSSGTIPALLQIEGYARAQLRTRKPKAPSDHFDEAVGKRMARKRVFDREEPPPYWAIVDEAALRRPVGGKETMADQLAHITKVLENPDIILQVLPFERGQYWMIGGSLTLLTPPNGSTIAYIESFGSGELVESTKRVVELSQQFDWTRGLALPENESLALIKNYLEEYR